MNCIGITLYSLGQPTRKKRLTMDLVVLKLISSMYEPLLCHFAVEGNKFGPGLEASDLLLETYDGV